MSVTVLAPLSGDTVTCPIRVLAGYSTTAAFNMTCKVDVTPEIPAQPHGAGSDIHSSTDITVGASGSTGYVVRADGDNGAGSDSQSGVIVTSGTPPIATDTVTEPGPIPVAGGMRMKKKRKIDGTCNPTLSPPAAYVICRIYEIDVTTHFKAVVAAGADTVKEVGAKRKWSVEVEFMMDLADHTLQYVARTTAYDKDDNPLGVHTKHITK